MSPHVRSKGQADLIDIGFRTTFVDKMCIVFLAVMFNNSKKHTYITLKINSNSKSKYEYTLKCKKG